MLSEYLTLGSPTALNGSIVSGSGVGTSSCSSNLSPNVSSYLRQNLSSTPATKGTVQLKIYIYIYVKHIRRGL